MRRLAVLASVTACSFSAANATSPDGDANVGDDGADPDGGVVVGVCDPLPMPSTVTTVATVAELRAAVAAARPGDTIVLADGTYSLAGGNQIAIATPDVTLRSASGDASKVVIDGGLDVVQLVAIRASNVTLTALTIAHAIEEGVRVNAASGTITGTRIHDVTFLDDGGPAIRVSPGLVDAGPFADAGTISCSRFVDTPTGADHCTPNQIGIEASAALDWVVRDNVFDNVRCETDYRRNIVFRAGSRGTKILRNVIRGSNMNIMIGTNNAAWRTYPDALPVGCSGIPDHRDGIVCNNLVDGRNVPPMAGNTDFEEGVALWAACDTWVLHNTIVSPGGVETYYDIEYRWPESYVHLVNNLLEELPGQRDGGTQDPAFAASSMTYTATDFVDMMQGDFHVSPSSTVPPGAPLASVPPDVLAACATDLDGRQRDPTSPTPGAYER